MLKAANIALVFVALCMSAGAATSSCAGQGVDVSRAEQLERLVRQDCGSCHGMTLKGGLGPDIRATALKGADVETIAQIILDGVPDTPMPPWRPLISENDARWIASYLLKETSQ